MASLTASSDAPPAEAANGNGAHKEAADEEQPVSALDVEAAPADEPEFKVPHLSYFQVLKLFLKFGCLAVGGPVRAGATRAADCAAGCADRRPRCARACDRRCSRLRWSRRSW